MFQFLLELAVSGRAALAQLPDLANGQQRVVKRQQVDGFLDILDQVIGAPLQINGDTGLAQQVEIAVKTADVQVQSLGQDLAFLGATGQKLDQPAQPNAALRSDRFALGSGFLGG